MTRKTIIWGVMVLGCTVQAMAATAEDSPPEYMSKEDRETLKEEARDMFYHAYNAYMDNAYPADELMPLSCKGRYRSTEPDRGDIDSTLGNFSLTLVDTLDTLVVLGDLGEFENAVRLVVRDVTFDTDVIVSLFETNIRMLGGLLSGHILAEYLQSRADIMPWYRGELLNLAKDLGFRFLPAFNTTTGIPFGRINLRHGMKGVPAEMCRETCTACAGSMILEMAALSRLTGESVFEDKAQRAMDALWKMRHRGTDLMGSVLNVHSGDWVRRDSGVGAGIDSYYEYCLKAYILLGDEKYLGRFNKHYQAVMKYVSQGPMLLDVHMHRPNTNSKNFMDALLAFWPGLQVLKGDIKPAVETHEMLYQVMQRHNFIPEAFTTDFQVHWGHHPLRPEFLESTYFLYRATGDHYYLGVGRKVLKSLQTYARVPCGYAAVSDVRTNKNDDTMDSFVLSETLKYLYLLFAEPNDLVLDLDEFIFTTEGHLLPLTLAALRTNVTSDLDRDIVQVDELGRICPNSLHLFPASVRQPLRNMVEDVCPRRSLRRRLNASQFQANNVEHLKILGNMGITILTPAAGRVQVLHTFSNARTALDAEEGLLFMQEMIELSKKQSEQTETRPQTVTFMKNDETPPREVILLAGPAHFGRRLTDGKKVTGMIEYANPFDACTELIEPEKLVGKIVLGTRGNCMFVEKARRIQKAGAIAGIVLDTVPGSNAAESAMFAMSGDGRDPDDVTIPVVFLFTNEAAQLVTSQVADDALIVTIGDYTPREEIQLNAPGDLSTFERVKRSLKDFLTRQITAQNSASRTAETNLPASENFDVTGGELRPEFKINNYLTATLFKNDGYVKIVRNELPPPPPKIPEFPNAVEKNWHASKQLLVNKVYTYRAGYHAISLTLLKLQYEIMHNLRGLEIPAGNIPEPVLLEWLCEELRDISPDNKSSKIGEPSDDTNNIEITFEKLFHKATRDLFYFKDLDSELKKFGIASASNEELSDSSESCSMEIDLKDSVDSIKSKAKWQDPMDMPDDAKEALLETVLSMFIDFEFFLLADIDAAGKNNPDREYVDNEKPIIICHEQYKAFLSHDKKTVRINAMKNVREHAKVDKTAEQMNSYEEIWQRLRHFLVAAIYSYDDKSVTIPSTIIESQYRKVQELRGFTAQEKSLEVMTMWYLRELGELRPRQHEIDKLRDRRIGRTDKERLFLDMREFLQNPSRYKETVDPEKRINRLEDEKNKESEIFKIEDSDETKNLFKLKEAMEKSEISQGDRSPHEETVQNFSQENMSIFPEKVEGEREKKISQKYRAGDPMEEFKKPVWAPDDERFSAFQGKSQFPNDHYEDSTQITKDRTKTSRVSERIKDDL